MTYIIDGHNLIPKIPGLSLREIDDEIRLIQLLQDFCRVQRKKVEVYFDNAPAGQAATHRFGQVTAHFVRQGKTADSAIRQRLTRLGKDAGNWTVVSSDGAVQSTGRAARAKVISSESFVVLMQKSLEGAAASLEEQRDAKINPEEVDEWIKLFDGNPDKNKKKSA
jgi:predicted RNA-binding protein with PIN domain